MKNFSRSSLNKRGLFVPFLFLVALLVGASGYAKSGEIKPEYQILSTDSIEFTQEQIRQYKTKLGLEAVLPTKCGARLYSIEYPTVDVEGNPTTASGLVVIPISSENRNFPVVSYQHGTVTGGERIPSQLQQNYSWQIAATLGASCFVTLAADYLGLGKNKNFQAYLHSDSEARVTRDMLWEGIAFARTKGVVLNGNLFLWGHSQGGHVTLSLQRFLEQDQEIRLLKEKTNLVLKGSFAASGPTDLVKSAQTTILYPARNTTSYGALLLYSMNKVYKFAKGLGPFIRSPFQEKMDSLFDGSKNMAEIQKVLPLNPDELFQAEFLTQIKNQTDNPFSARLKINDVYNWKPQTPLHLVHGQADLDVPYFNSTLAFETMKSLGATVVQFTDLGERVNHSEAYLKGMVIGVHWFEDMNGTH